VFDLIRMAPAANATGHNGVGRIVVAQVASNHESMLEIALEDGLI
jgi:hypothetical protein